MGQSFLCIGGPLDGQRVGLEGVPNSFLVPEVSDPYSGDPNVPVDIKNIEYRLVELVAPIAGTATSRRWDVYTNEDQAEVLGKMIERYTPPPTAETKSFWARTVWQLINRFVLQARENGHIDEETGRKIREMLSQGAPR